MGGLEAGFYPSVTQMMPAHWKRQNCERSGGDSWCWKGVWNSPLTSFEFSSHKDLLELRAISTRQQVWWALPWVQK